MLVIPILPYSLSPFLVSFSQFISSIWCGVLGYFTGSRDFVDYIVAKVEDSAESKKYVADSIAEDPMGYARSQIQGFIQNPGSISVSKQGCFCVRVHLLHHFGKNSHLLARKNICYEKGTFASLYHRRFRPAMNWDNKWRPGGFYEA